MSHKKTVKKMDNKKSTKKTAVILTVCFVALALLCAFCVWLIIDTLDKKIEGELNSPTATPQENVYIEFGDEALEQEIKDRYGFTTNRISTNQVSSVTSLNIADLGSISSLKGLEMFSSLATLTIRNTQVGDLSAIGESDVITRVNFYNVDFTNSVFEGSADSVANVQFSECVLTEEIIGKFGNITGLIVRDCGIEDLSLFSGMSKMETLFD